MQVIKQVITIICAGGDECRQENVALAVRSAKELAMQWIYDSVALIDIESNLTSGQNISLRVNIIKSRC